MGRAARGLRAPRGLRARAALAAAGSAAAQQSDTLLARLARQREEIATQPGCRLDLNLRGGLDALADTATIAALNAWRVDLERHAAEAAARPDAALAPVLPRPRSWPGCTTRIVVECAAAASSSVAAWVRGHRVAAMDDMVGHNVPILLETTIGRDGAAPPPGLARAGIAGPLTHDGIVRCLTC